MRIFSHVLVLAITASSSAQAQPAPEARGAGHGQLAAPAPNTAEEANASPARAVKLSELLSLAVRQNPTLEKAAIDVSIAHSDVVAARGLDDWAIGLVSSYDQGSRGKTAKLGTSASKEFSTGGNASVQVGAQHVRREVYTEDAGAQETQEIQETKPYVTFSLSQPLLRGAGSRVARAAQRTARVGKNISTVTRQISALSVIRQIIDAYWELAYSIEALEISRSSVVLAQEQLRITKAAIDNGAAAPSALLAVEQSIAVREEAVLNAEVAVAERSLEVRRLVGLEIGPGEVTLATAEILTTEAREYNLDTTLALALGQNPQLALIRLQGDSADIGVQVAEDETYAALDFSASAGTDDGTLAIVGSDEEQIAVSVNLSYTQVLGNNAAEGSRARARHNVRKVRVDLREAKQEISVQVVRAVNLVRAAGKRIEVSKLASDLAEQNVEVERKRFLAGRSTNFDVLQRQDELQRARLNHARAIVDHRKAVALVDSLTGELLTRNGIDVIRNSDS